MTKVAMNPSVRRAEAQAEADTSEQAEQLDPQQLYMQVVACMNDRPDDHERVYKILVLVQEHQAQAELVSAIAALPEMQVCNRTPLSYVRQLQKAGGIKGTPDDPANPTTFTYELTDVGKQVIADFAPDRELAALLARESEAYQAIYKQVLAFCTTPRSRQEVDELLEGNEAMKEPRVYASYFLDGLEASGGIVWKDGWCTTEAGEVRTGS